VVFQEWEDSGSQPVALRGLRPRLASPRARPPWGPHLRAAWSAPARQPLAQETVPPPELALPVPHCPLRGLLREPPSLRPAQTPQELQIRIPFVSQVLGCL